MEGEQTVVEYEWAVFADNRERPYDGAIYCAEDEADAYARATAWRLHRDLKNVQVMRRPVAEWEPADGARDD